MSKMSKKISEDQTLLLDKDILGQLGVKSDDTVEIEFQSGVLIISPSNKSCSQEEFEDIVEKIIETRRETLKILSQ